MNNPPTIVQGDPNLANHPSALKRARQNEVKRVRNKSYKTRVKKTVKEVRTAIAANSAEQAEKSFKEAVSVIQKTASKGVIHKNQASRKISRLARGINRLVASEG
jgi:small subunit ribosomal protein S20